jgi:GT2 family glycosyltransferase
MSEISKQNPRASRGDTNPSQQKAAAAKPAVSVVVATRNRGRSVVGTIHSLLANNHPSFEVIVIDQSTDDVTEEAVSRMLADPRLRYVRSETVGYGRAHNLGLRLARAPIVAMTDDDCIVPPDWVEMFDSIFRAYPRVAVAYSNVLPAEHDPELGFVPAYVRSSNRLTRSLWRLPFTVGIGASMAVRRDAVRSLGGFDPALGPGGEFHSAGDRDIAARALVKGWHVYETADVAVSHDGFRTWDEGKELTARNWFGLGAAWAKLLKSGYPQVLSFIVHFAFVAGLWQPLTEIFQFRRPRFVRRQVHFWRGFVTGLQTAVDRSHLRFEPAETDTPSA